MGALDPTAGHCSPMSLPEIPGHSQASLAQSLVGSLLLFPGSWCTQRFVPSKSLFPPLPVLWKFYNPIPLSFKVKFPGGSQSLCWIPRLGNLLCTLELSEQCENFFDVIVLQIVCWVALWWGSQATPPRSAAVRAPVPMADHC